MEVQSEPLPKDIAVGCHVLNDSEEVKGVWFVFAKASDASGRTYYVLNGYEVDSKPTRDDPQYTAGGFGFILNVDREKCEVLEADARQVFRARIFDDDFPFDMMQKLATNYAARLVAAYGSAQALRREAARQRISLENQSEALRHALGSQRATKP
ncbi:hypothetical protein AB2N08_16360 [Massilia aurea]|uniref:hypothetical protein n=1 Tax=Massilia aurea TaxID=373040 RepID=UPI003462ACC6